MGRGGSLSASPTAGGCELMDTQVLASLSQPGEAAEKKWREGQAGAEQREEENESRNLEPELGSC